MNILFVCTGNTCRSPMAEGYLRSKALKDVNVSSRGLYADGSAISKNSEAVMKEIGIDLSRHISRQISPDDIVLADKIICLSPSHKAALLSAGAPKEKLFVLGNGISDPYGGNLQVYRRCRDEIINATDELIKSGFFNSFIIVPIEQRYISPIAKLEKVCFSEPWSAEGLLDSYKSGTKFFAAENGSRLIGYIGIKAVIDEGYITNVAVFPQYRRQGAATALINKVFEFAKEKSLSFVSLEVRVSNSEAVSLYEKLGFVTEGQRKDFYRNPREDALIMTKRFSINNENTCD